MENKATTEKLETQDFMNVESFSQLPFIRPHAPVKEKGIRLFGIQFGELDSAADSSSTLLPAAETNNIINEDLTTSVIKENDTTNTNVVDNNSNNNRRFECHYCCRNFPTSQALGGHQNAHKRERQHAKRAHLQSAMVHNSFTDHAHIYGLMNYSRFADSAAPAPAPNITYPSWTSTASTRFYGSHGSYSHHQPPTITGSPLGLWRIPGTATAVQSHHGSFNRDRSMQNPLPLFASDHQELKTSHMQVGASSSSQSRFVYESKSRPQDPVSLDLHL